VWLRVKYELPGLPPLPTINLGAVHLAVSNGAATRYVGVRLERGTGVDECAALDDLGGTFKMVCTP